MAFLETAVAGQLLKALAPLAGAAALVAAGFAAGEVYEHKAPWGLSHQLTAARADRDAWRKAQGDTQLLAVAWAQSFGKAKALRALERAQAVAAVNASAQACDTRVAAARRSALAIQSLVTMEVPRDPQGCPVRRLLDPRQLWDAVRPAAPAGG